MDIGGEKEAPRRPSAGEAGQDDWPGEQVKAFRTRYENVQCGLLSEEGRSRVSIKAKSLMDLDDVTVNVVDVEQGYCDIAGLRSDGSGTFWSNFTSQSFAVPLCVIRTRFQALIAAWAFLSFFVCAVQFLIFNHQAVLMLFSGLLSVFLCSQKVLDIREAYQTSAIFIGIIFPMVFLIGQTWARREKAMERLATIKANAVQLILKMITHDNATNPNATSRALKLIDRTILLMKEIGMYLPQDSSHSGFRLCSIYGHFAELQSEPETMMLTRFMLVEFEKLRGQRDYRTPWKLNYFCFMIGTFSPIICAPLFASMGCKDRYPSRAVDDGVECGSWGGGGFGTLGAYLSAGLFSILISSLLSIVKAMEDPFSLSGPDDVISTFSFEANALMHLIEDRKPGALNKGLEYLLNNNDSERQDGWCEGKLKFHGLSKDEMVKRLLHQEEDDHHQDDEEDGAEFTL